MLKGGEKINAYLPLDSNIGSFWLFVHIKRKASLYFLRQSQTLGKEAICSPCQERGFAEGMVVTWRNSRWGI